MTFSLVWERTREQDRQHVGTVSPKHCVYTLDHIRVVSDFVWF